MIKVKKRDETMPYKAIIWDLDGTLLNTLQDLSDAVNHSLTQYSLPTRTVEEIRAFVGNGIRSLVERAVPAGTDGTITDAVFAEFRTYYAAHSADHTAPYAGIPAMLMELSRAGIRMAIVSNKADFAVQDLVRRYFGEEISLAVGAREDMPKKPAPDMVEYALTHLGVAKAETAYVGDSEVDVITARNTGMDCLSVSWGFRSPETLREAGAEQIFSTPRELMEAITKM